MSEMIERVARAIAAENSDDFDKIPDNKSEWTKAHGEFNGRFRDVNEPFKGDYIEMAIAAVKSMRNPTEAMFEATDHICERTGDELEIYHAFIDAALK